MGSDTKRRAGGGQVWAYAITLAIGCGNGADGAPSGAAGASGSGGAAGASDAPTFTRVWNEVLVYKGCTGEFCHGAGTGSLSLDNQHEAYLNLVGVAATGPACGASGQLRVSPGQPAASLLLDKLSHAAPSCGDPMPIGVRFEPDCLSPSPAVCTTAAEIELVRAWIAAGALEN